MFYYLVVYLMGVGHGFIFSKNKESIKKDLDNIFNLFMEKTKLNRVEYSHLNNYMDVINQKLDVLLNKINPKEKNNIDESLDESLKDK